MGAASRPGARAGRRGGGPGAHGRALTRRTVLYVHSSAGRYGADRQLGLLATGLDPARWRAVVALPQEGPLAVELRGAGVEVVVRRLAVLRRARATPRGLGGVALALAGDARALGALARERKAALVHTNTSVTLGGAAAARAVGVPHIWHVRESYEDLARLWPAYRRVLTTAAALPCVSAAVAAQFAGAPQVRVVHDGLGVVPRRAPRAAARAVLGLPSGAFVVALAGRLSAWKGQDVLVRALAEASLGGAGAHEGTRSAAPAPETPAPTVALLAGDAWAGDPQPAERLRTLATQLGVGDRVVLAGFCADIHQVYGAADVVAVPSTRPDPLPNAALEAAAAGCCVVASHHGGLPEILRDGRTGLLVAPGDPQALAASLAALRDDPARRAALGAAAADDVRERFAPGRLAEAVQDLYDDVLRRRG